MDGSGGTMYNNFNIYIFRTILYRKALLVNNIMVLTFTMLKAVFDKDLLNCPPAGQDVGFLTAETHLCRRREVDLDQFTRVTERDDTA